MGTFHGLNWEAAQGLPMLVDHQLSWLSDGLPAAASRDSHRPPDHWPAGLFRATVDHHAPQLVDVRFQIPDVQPQLRVGPRCLPPLRQQRLVVLYSLSTVVGVSHGATKKPRATRFQARNKVTRGLRGGTRPHKFFSFGYMTAPLPEKRRHCLQFSQFWYYPAAKVKYVSRAGVFCGAEPCAPLSAASTRG